MESLTTEYEFHPQVKRRWDDDVVFKNCARSEPDKKKEQQFINDSLRSEFHRKFMEKYVK
jgi:protein CWC15